MFIRAILFFVAACMALGVPQKGMATGDDSFTVRGHKIEMPASRNLSRTRDKATDRAMREGLGTLLKNLTPRQVWDRHEEVISQVDWQRVLEKFVIVEERTSPKYNVTLDLFYRASYIKDVLTGLNIPYGTATKATVLVIPLLELPERRMLWEESNPWRQAYLATLEQTSGIEFVLPLGDMQEIMMLTPEMAAFGAADVLIKLGEQYSADAVVVSYARLEENFGNRFIEVENIWYGKRLVEPLLIKEPFPPHIGFEAVLQLAAQRSLITVEDTLQQASLVRVDKPGQIFVRYTPQGPADLERLKALMSSLEVVERVKLRVLNIKNSLFEVDFFGDDDKFADTLQQNGLDVEITGALWRVKFSGQPESRGLFDDQ